MRYRVCMIAVATMLAAAVACAQGRPQLLDAVVARGDKAMSAGNSEQARATWGIVLAFEPNYPSAKKKIDALPGEGFSAKSEEMSFVTQAMRGSSSEDWCGFPAPTATTDLGNLKMLADERLLPSLRATSISAQSGPCSGSGVFLFLAKPALSIAEVRQTYGPPQAERKHADGSMVLTYGRLRIVGAKDGSGVVVFFPPFAK